MTSVSNKIKIMAWVRPDARRDGIAQNVIGLSSECVWATPWLYTCSAASEDHYAKNSNVCIPLLLFLLTSARHRQFS